jgi:hypothetical protein
MSKKAVVLIAAVLAGGCGVKHIQSLRDAEVVFNRAAETDNRERFDAPSGILNSAGALADYRMASLLLDDLINKQQAKLKEDGLLCTAIALQGLSKWRSGDHDAAISAVRSNGAQECTTTSAAKTAPRDAAIIRAVPGLIRIDQANAMVENQTLREEAAVEKLIADAHTDLSAAMMLLTADSPMREYLIVSHLAGARVMQQSIERENVPEPGRSRINASYKRDAACWLGRYSAMTGLNGTNFEARVGTWKNLLATDADLQACGQ